MLCKLTLSLITQLKLFFAKLLMISWLLNHVASSQSSHFSVSMQHDTVETTLSGMLILWIFFDIALFGFLSFYQSDHFPLSSAADSFISYIPPAATPQGSVLVSLHFILHTFSLGDLVSCLVIYISRSNLSRVPVPHLPIRHFKLGSLIDILVQYVQKRTHQKPSSFPQSSLSHISNQLINLFLSVLKLPLLSTHMATTPVMPSS